MRRLWAYGTSHNLEDNWKFIHSKLGFIKLNTPSFDFINRVPALFEILTKDKILKIWVEMNTQ